MWYGMDNPGTINVYCIDLNNIHMETKCTILNLGIYTWYIDIITSTWRFSCDCVTLCHTITRHETFDIWSKGRGSLVAHSMTSNDGMESRTCVMIKLKRITSCNWLTPPSGHIIWVLSSEHWTMWHITCTCNWLPPPSGHILSSMWQTINHNDIRLSWVVWHCH